MHNLPHTTLGATSLNASRVGLGCMSLGTARQAAAAIIHRAFELGVNLFDTADIYDRGLNESIVGEALRDRRDRVYILSKGGNRPRPDGPGWDWTPRRDYLIAACEASLKRLGTDYIDLYLLHGGTIEDPIDEVVEAFETLKRRGAIRHYGFSSIRPNVIRSFPQHGNFEALMTQYSLLDRRPEASGTLDMARQQGMALLLRGALAQGLLAGKSAAAYNGLTETQVAAAQDALKAALPPGMGLAQGAISYALSHPAAGSVLVGASHIGQLEKSLRTPYVWPEETLAALRAAVPAQPYSQHL